MAPDSGCAGPGPARQPIPQDCRFARTHEWFKAKGVTQLAAEELTDSTRVELPIALGWPK